MAQCDDCREVLKCPKCSVPMVYHKAGHKLLCHYCGTQLDPPPKTCPACGGKLLYRGFGTQKAEEELAQLFPEARVLRMDQDSTAAKDAHEKLLAKFARHEYDIMVGTQMVAKGLDFEDVTLVGVLGIDSLLFAQGFRAYETVFSLITQVVGRSGRAKDPGFAIIQTTDPDNPVLNLAAAQDYDAFFEQEIAYRKLGLYPPFCGLCVVGFSGPKEIEVARAAAVRPRSSRTCPSGCLAPPPATSKRSTRTTATSSPSSAAPTNASATLSARPSASTSRKSCPARPRWWWICILTVIFDKIIWRYTSWLSATL